MCVHACQPSASITLSMHIGMRLLTTGVPFMKKICVAPELVIAFFVGSGNAAPAKLGVLSKW